MLLLAMAKEKTDIFQSAYGLGQASLHPTGGMPPGFVFNPAAERQLPRFSNAAGLPRRLHHDFR